MWKIFCLLVKISPVFSIILIVISIIDGVIVFLRLLVWKNILDSLMIALSNGNITEVSKWLIIHFILSIVGILLNKMSEYLKNNQGDVLNIFITQIILEKINVLEYHYFEQPDIYNKIEKVNSESAQRLSHILDTIILLIKYTSTMVGAIVIVFRLSYMAVVLSLISIIPMFFVIIKFSLINYSNFLKRVEKMRFIIYLKYIFTNHENLKEIKIFRIGDYLKDIILNTLNKYFKEDKEIRKKSIIYTIFTEFLQSILTYSLKLYIVIIVIKEKLGIGNFSMYISAIDKFQNSVGNILGIIAKLYIDNLYISNLFDLIELDIENKSNENSKIIFDGTFSVIKFSDVYFKYPNTDNYILKNINIEIKSNKSYSFVGLNGSGKTTLVKLLIGLYEPTKGTIFIDGIDMKKFNKISLYKHMGVIFQDYIKYPFTVRENIAIGNIEEFNNYEYSNKVASLSGASEFIDKLPHKYETKLQKEWTGGVDLSLGQWQKLAISRALMSKGCILILDEPTASLDAKAEYELFQKFKYITSTSTCILIYHRFSTVKLVDVIFVLDKGYIVEKGSHTELLNKEDGIYSRLYNMQAESYH